jgi:hypothetical protein
LLAVVFAHVLRRLFPPNEALGTARPVGFRFFPFIRADPERHFSTRGLQISLLFFPFQPYHAFRARLPLRGGARMASPTLSFKERRLAPRRVPNSNTRVTCHRGPHGLGPNLALGLVDVSEIGLRLLAASAFEKSQELDVALCGPGLSRPCQVPAELVWCQPGPEGQYTVGARFQRRLRYGDLVHLI